MLEPSRRAVLPGMLAWVGGCTLPALAQPAAAAVRMPAMPCATQPGDIVGLLLDGSGAPAGTIVVFGQAFAAGDLPRDGVLSARLADGAAIAVQADVRTRHADGSVRFAVVSLAAPALRRGDRVGVVLARAGAPVAAAALDVVAALAGRQAVLEITPDGGGVPWRADLLASFRTALQGHGAAVWQSGPLAVQARAVVPVPPEAVGGAARPRLVADVAIRADGVLWVAAWVRNDRAMEAAGGVARYGLKLLLDGREVLAFPRVQQAQYQVLGRTRASVRAGPAPAIPHVRHDATYLARFGAVQQYDFAAGIDESLLTRGAQAIAAAEWGAPFSPRGLTLYMPTTGSRPEIGPSTLWQAAWLISGDPRAAQYALGQAEAIGGVPWHYWDEAHGTWLNTDHYAKIWTETRETTGRPADRNAPALAQLFPPPAEVGGWRQDDAHQPDVCTVAFMLTGERWIFDNLQAQSAAAVLQTAPVHRGDSGINMANGPQQRSVAWGLRQIDNAAWLSPEGSAEQKYFQKVSDYNWRWLVGKIPDWTSKQGAAFGWLPGTVGAPGVLAPWQQDYFATTAALAAIRGSADARRFLEWQSNFLVGRFTNEAKGFPPAYGVAFLLAIGEPTPTYAIDGPLYRTWAAMADAHRQRNLAEQPWSNGTLNQLGLATLAGIANAVGSQEALRTFQALQAMRLPGTSLADFQAEPTFSIVPRGFTRAAAPLPACQPARPGPLGLQRSLKPACAQS